VTKLDVFSERLGLLPLTAHQLSQYVAAPELLEQELGFPISRDVVTDTLRRAIGLKISKIRMAEESFHPWFTYWLIVISEKPYGVGLVGFKGHPDSKGEVEIGYGIDPAYQGKGYMTEAVRSLIGWAFQHEDCLSVIAPNTQKSNVASNRVLEKVGMKIYHETTDALFWRSSKQSFVVES